MADLDKTIKEMENCTSDFSYCYLCPHHKHMACKTFLLKNALELLKGYKKLKEHLEELHRMENSRVKDCDSSCDWEARNYHRGRFDAYSIALAHFDRKDGDGK